MTSSAPFSTACGRHWAAIGPGSSHHRDAGWKDLLLVTGPGSRPTDSASVALDKVADSALFFVLDDPSSPRLAGGTWIPSSGVWLSIESSISWLFFAAAAALRFRFCSAAFSNASHASGNQSLHTWQGASWGGTAGIGSGYRSVFCSASNQETSVAAPWKMTYHVTPPPFLVVNKARLTTKTE